jgi:SRSO17 transposase
MISELPRKSLPAIARAVGLPNDQVLHHCLSESPWSVAALQKRRLELILQQLNDKAITLVMDDTGDCKKGNTTDYVARQYIGNLGKIENGIVSLILEKLRQLIQGSHFLARTAVDQVSGSISHFHPGQPGTDPIPIEPKFRMVTCRQKVRRLES